MRTEKVREGVGFGKAWPQVSPSGRCEGGEDAQMSELRVPPSCTPAIRAAVTLQTSPSTPPELSNSGPLLPSAQTISVQFSVHKNGRRGPLSKGANVGELGPISFGGGRPGSGRTCRGSSGGPSPSPRTPARSRSSRAGQSPATRPWTRSPARSSGQLELRKGLEQHRLHQLGQGPGVHLNQDHEELQGSRGDPRHRQHLNLHQQHEGSGAPEEIYNERIKSLCSKGGPPFTVTHLREKSSSPSPSWRESPGPGQRAMPSPPKSMERKKIVNIIIEKENYQNKEQEKKIKECQKLFQEARRGVQKTPHKLQV